MMKYCVHKWDENKKYLEAALRQTDCSEVTYDQLMKAVVVEVLNRGAADESEQLSVKRMRRIDDGQYQGTIIYIVPFDTYQPDESEYLMTFVNYGSCSGCDTLERIKSDMPWDDEHCETCATEQTIKDLMTLCKDLLTRMIRPFNNGWRDRPEFEEATV